MKEHYHLQNSWQAPIIEDMVQDGKAGLTEAIVTGPGCAILFYGQQSLGEGLSLGKVQDATFMLSGAFSWVGKHAQLSAKPASLGDGQRLTTQAIAEGHINHEGPVALVQSHPLLYHLIFITKICPHGLETFQW